MIKDPESPSMPSAKRKIGPCSHADILHRACTPLAARTRSPDVADAFRNHDCGNMSKVGSEHLEALSDDDAAPAAPLGGQGAGGLGLASATMPTGGYDRIKSATGLAEQSASTASAHAMAAGWETAEHGAAQLDGTEQQVDEDTLEDVDGDASTGCRRALEWKNQDLSSP